MTSPDPSPRPDGGAPPPPGPLYPAPDTFPGAVPGATPEAVPGQVRAPAWGAPGTAGPGTPGAPAAAASRPPVPFAALLAAGARRAGAGCLLGLLLSLVQVVLAVLVIDDLSWGAVVSGPPLLVAMGLLGSARVSFLTGSDLSLGLFGSTDLSASVRAVPLSVLIAIVLGIVVVTVVERRTGRLPAATGTLPRDRWITAALTGGVLSVVTSALAAATSISVPSQGLRISGFGIDLVLGALLVGGLASALGDALGSRGRVDWPRLGLRVRPVPEVRAALLSVGVLLGLPAFVLWLVGVVAAAGTGLDALAALPALGANAVLAGVAVVTGGALQGSTSAGSSSGLLDGLDPSSDQLTLLTVGAQAWVVVLLVLLALLSALAAAVVLARRRPGTPWSRSWLTAVVFAAVGGVLTILGTVSTSGSFLGLSMSGRFGIAPWWFLVLVGWAALVELLARTVVPLLVGLLPARARAAAGPLVAAAPAVGPGLVPAAGPDTSPAAGPDTSPAVGPEAGPAVGAVPAPAPMHPRTRRRLTISLVVAGTVAVLGIGGAIAVDQINRRAFGPEGAVQDYLDALEAGSASAVLDGAASGSSGAEPLLADEVYAAATDRPTAGRILDVDRSGDDAQVTVEYQQGDETVTETVWLVREGRTAGVFDQWRLYDPSTGDISLYLPTGTETLLVNGVEIEADTVATLAALPGTYTLALPGTQWEESTEVVATVLGSAWTTVDAPDLVPSAALEAEAVRQAEDHLAACIARTETSPEDCPNAVWPWSTLSEVTWTLDEAPVLALDDSGSWSGDYDLSTEQTGTATVTGTYASDSLFGGAAGEVYTRTVEITMRGYVTIDGGTVTFHYGW